MMCRLCNSAGLASNRPCHQAFIVGVSFVCPLAHINYIKQQSSSNVATDNAQMPRQWLRVFACHLVYCPDRARKLLHNWVHFSSSSYTLDWLLQDSCHGYPWLLPRSVQSTGAFKHCCFKEYFPKEHVYRVFRKCVKLYFSSGFC